MTTTTPTRKRKDTGTLIKNYRAVFRQREHRCSGNPVDATCVILYRVTDEDAPEDKIELVDENGKFYNSCFTFKECTPINKTMADRL